MHNHTDHITTRNATCQAALTAQALERITAQIIAARDAIKTHPAIARELLDEAAAEVWAHADALLIASTQPTIDRLTGNGARIIR